MLESERPKLAFETLMALSRLEDLAPFVSRSLLREHHRRKRETEKQLGYGRERMRVIGGGIAHD